MHHTPDVRFVDAHAEGNGGHHHLHLVVQERFVSAPPLLLEKQSYDLFPLLAENLS